MRIIRGKLGMLRIIAVIAKAIFSTWCSYFQTISFMGHVSIKDPALDSVTFMASVFFEIRPSWDLSNFRQNKMFFGSMPYNITA